jgi:antitoxin ParD1/3/4
MASMKTFIRVELSSKQAAILQRQMKSGHYRNPEEVMQDALLALDKRAADFDEWLRTEVTASIADKRAPAPIDEVFKRVRARVARKVKAAKRVA